MERQITTNLTGKETDTIIAALRLYQSATPRALAQVHDIATNCGEHDDMTADEIDSLCEALNCSQGVEDAGPRAAPGQVEWTGALVIAGAAEPRAVLVDKDQAALDLPEFLNRENAKPADVE